jgi:carboxyl-terminal processing protease
LTGDIGGGVGAEIGIRNSVPTVISVLPDTPALQAGVKAGDVLDEVNEQPLTKLTVDEIVQIIRGKIGTTVKLTITRDGEQKYFNITRADITSPSVTSKVNGDVGILTITRFDEQTGAQARTEGNKLKAAGVKKVILDLRDNGGGYLTAAPEVAGLWLNNKLVATEKRDGKVLDQQSTDNNAIFDGMPTVVLVNAGTASAAEIVSAALKDQDSNVSLVGELTYGKGTVQTTINMPGGALLKVTIQRWYTPKDKNIDGKGLTPDMVVGLTNTDILAGRDPQVDAALKQLGN